MQIGNAIAHLLGEGETDVTVLNAALERLADLLRARADQVLEANAADLADERRLRADLANGVAAYRALKARGGLAL